MVLFAKVPPQSFSEVGVYPFGKAIKFFHPAKFADLFVIAKLATTLRPHRSNLTELSLVKSVVFVVFTVFETKRSKITGTSFTVGVCKKFLKPSTD
ncbi:hypothetical protein [Enterococcus hirae]|uniref:hypothetical protein n=1 Tax=Enterococcus hirae TaxID=1354 RepID=UPI0030D0EC29